MKLAGRVKLSTAGFMPAQSLIFYTQGLPVPYMEEKASNKEVAMK